MNNQEIINAMFAKSETYEGLDLTMRMRYYYVQGFSVAWSYRGENGSFCYGKMRRGEEIPIDSETLFQAGSISKAVFAGLVMRLYDAGLIDIHEDVNHYLKDYTVVAPSGEKITLRTLLSHMAGFNVHGFAGYSSDTGQTNEDVIHGRGNSLRLEIDFPPHTCWRYSGGGYQIAQKAVEDALGESTQNLAEKYVFTPLELKNSGYWQPLCPEREAQAAYGWNLETAHYHFYPERAAAGLWSTPSDLVGYALALRKSLETDSFLTQKTAREMTTQAWKARCVGLFTDDTCSEYYHGGSNRGFESLMLFSAREDFAFAIMANTNGASALNRQIAQTVKAAFGI